jgi:hypothetical protein
LYLLAIALEASTMSLEQSPTRQKKASASPFAPVALEPFYTRDEVAARYRHTTTWVTRNYRRLGLKPSKFGKRILFAHSQLVELDRRALAGEVEMDLSPDPASTAGSTGTNGSTV